MTNENRAYIDPIENASDRDLLLILNTKMTSTCKKIDSIETTLKDHIKDIGLKCDHRKEVCEVILEKKLPGFTFWKLVAILTIVLGVLFTTSITNRVDVVKNTTVIKYNSEQILKNIEMLKKIEKVTK